MKSPHYFMDVFLTRRFFLAGGVCVLLFLTSFFIGWLYPISQICIAVVIIFILADYLVLFFFSQSPQLSRNLPERLSNGDANPVSVSIFNRMRFPVFAELIDELPEQLQIRNFKIIRTIPARQRIEIKYLITPTERGRYLFGNSLLYLATPLKLIQRRYVFDNEFEASVYPSYRQLNNVQLLSTAFDHSGYGAMKMRKLGQSMEFEQIKEYVIGDDVRTVNWKATARRSSLMVNNYAEEKSQQVYCLIDKGRLMKMPFEGLTLLDYAINSTLVLSHVCLQKQDKIGLITFADKMGTVLPADRRPVQRENILNALYKQKTDFLEPDFEMLYMQIRNRIRQRSLLILFTNFETMSGARRQIPYLRLIARYHLLLVVFFENTELKMVAASRAKSVEDIYVQTIADQFLYEKRMIVKELSNHGILSVLTPPQKLTVNAVNKYLELKSRQAI